MFVVQLSTGKRFAVEPGESLLDAAARSNVGMPYSCRTGRCSSCKCKVVKGLSAPLNPELGLTDSEKEAGWILSCVRTAVTDLSLEVEAIRGPLPPIRTLPCRIHAMERLAADVLKVMLRLPPGSDFAFIPGQHIEVIGRGGLRRSYSLASSGLADSLLELHIRAVDRGAMSEFWFSHARVNDLLRLKGPLGTFFLRDVAGLHVVFLATGTGIAPVKAMIEGIGSMTIDERPLSVTVYWGGRTRGDLYWDVASTAVNRFAYVPVLSRAGDDWSGARGHVQEILLADQRTLSESIVFACGSEAMIQGAKQALVQSGLPEGRYLSDAFVCSSANRPE